jgi:hypothetical protein
MPTPPPNDRRNRRDAVAMTARVRSTGGMVWDVVVTDLTAEGCCIAKPEIRLRDRQRVSIKLEAIDYLLGTVKWAQASTAGIEFDRPLYGPVAEHLQRRFLR